MGKRAARTCASYLTKFWKDSQLPMRYNWGLSCMPLGGYNTYTTTQSPINKQPHRRRVPSLHAAAPQVKLVLRSQVGSWVHSEGSSGVVPGFSWLRIRCDLGPKPTLIRGTSQHTTSSA